MVLKIPTIFHKTISVFVLSESKIHKDWIDYELVMPCINLGLSNPMLCGKATSGSACKLPPRNSLQNPVISAKMGHNDLNCLLVIVHQLQFPMRLISEMSLMNFDKSSPNSSEVTTVFVQSCRYPGQCHPRCRQSVHQYRDHLPRQAAVVCDSK